MRCGNREVRGDSRHRKAGFHPHINVVTVDKSVEDLSGKPFSHYADVGHWDFDMDGGLPFRHPRYALATPSINKRKMK